MIFPLRIDAFSDTTISIGKKLIAREEFEILGN